VSRFNKIMPVLRVTDLQRAIDWYAGVFDFQLLWRSPADGGGENAMLRSGAVELMLSTGSHLGSDPKFTGTLYFETEGVQALYDRVWDRVDGVWPLEVTDYGTREFGVRDPDGYALAFSEDAGR
jgi:uncharacterized glyoxalase superfamily protein PhnB